MRVHIHIGRRCGIGKWMRQVREAMRDVECAGWSSPMKSMNEYRGIRHGSDTVADVEVTVNGSPLPPRLDLRNHSPTGLNWGYGGSGPAQLALAILAHEFGPDFALGAYQDFKREVVAGLLNSWRLDSAFLHEWRQSYATTKPRPRAVSNVEVTDWRDHRSERPERS